MTQHKIITELTEETKGRNYERAKYIVKAALEEQAKRRVWIAKRQKEVTDLKAIVQKTLLAYDNHDSEGLAKAHDDLSYFASKNISRDKAKTGDDETEEAPMYVKKLHSGMTIQEAKQLFK